MRNHIVTFETFDVVVVPFPFTDKTTTKRRPALVLSEAKPFNKGTAHSVLAMITSASHSDWPLDIDIEDDGIHVRKARPTDILFAKALEGTMSEWESVADEE
jgi:hypothetical protein